jgi:thiol:disulfide interchange protein DsbC
MRNQQGTSFMQRIVAFSIALLAIAASLAHADEAAVKRAVESRFGGIKVDSVVKTPYVGLYEVLTGDEIIYTDEKVTYLFSGNIIDAKTHRNLTEERLQKLSVIKFDDLPLDLAIKQVRGNGKHVVAVFSDPFCPFCRRLDQNLSQMQDTTVYTFLYPILRKDESPQMAARIWCSSDRAKAYYDLMLNNKAPGTAAGCNAPVDRWLALGQKLKISATPVSFVTNGQRVVGARFEDLQKLMNETVK